MSATRCMTALWIAAATLAAAAVWAEEATPKERVAKIERRLTAGDTMGAYLEARRLATDLAGTIALARLHHIVRTTDAPRSDDYQRTQEHRDLRIVTLDAWPALSAEWDKLPGPARGRNAQDRDGQDRKALIILFWRYAKEDRALERLAGYALKEKCILGALTVESLGRVPHRMRLRSMMTDQELDAYYTKLAAWWKKERAEWKGRMLRREEVATMASERE